MTDPALQSPRTPPAWSRRLPVHYGWLIVFVGLLVTASCLGIARFAFSMILPAMGEGLGLDRRQMGLVGTAGFVGYLAGALLSGRLTRRFGARGTIVGGLAVIVVTILLVAATQNVWQVLVAFAITGFGSGTGYICSVGLVSHWFLRTMRGRASGLVVTGSGYSIMLVGLLIPIVNARFGEHGWRISWVVLAGLVALAAATALVVLREEPADIGLEPVGHAIRHAGAVPQSTAAEQRRATIHLGLIYALFGMSYIMYVTFVVTTLVQDRGFSEQAAGRFWFLFGFLSIFSGPLFGWLSDRLGRRMGLAVSFVCHGVAYLLLGLTHGTAPTYLSVVVFGLSAWSVPGIMGAAVGDYMGPAQAVQALGRLTVFFGVGQLLGPAIAGSLAQAHGSFDSSYQLAGVLAIVAAVLSLLLRPPRGQGSQ